MDAQLIPGKPGRTKRERICQLDGLWAASDPYCRVRLIEVLDILDSPDEAPEPDMIQVTMTKEEAFVLKAAVNLAKWSHTGTEFVELMRRYGI